MEVFSLMSKKDWSAIFFADIFLLILLLITLAGKVAIWVMIGLIFILGAISFYMTFIKKYNYNDEEFENMVGQVKDFVGGKKK